MTSSLVGSEMCIRDRLYTVRLSSYNYSIGNGIAVDSQNHAVYVAGHLGNNESVTKVFLAKYNDNSEEMVYNVTEGLERTRSWARAVVLNGSESIYMVGGADEESPTAVVFLKFATNGTLMFSKLLEGIVVEGYALAIDKENNVILTGVVKEGDFQGLTNAGEEDIFLA
eukprot:10710729-Prorocentrum_lima.AAC.1